jgi:hypothetical protein
MRLCAERGLPPPRRAFLSAMASPDIPVDRRPWRQQRTLDEPEFKASLHLLLFCLLRGSI